MNRVKNFTAIHLQLNYTNVFEVVILSNQSEDLNLKVFNIITGMNESKILTLALACTV